MRNFAPLTPCFCRCRDPGCSSPRPRSIAKTRFGRKPPEGARPLLILWPFGPVAFGLRCRGHARRISSQGGLGLLAYGPRCRANCLVRGATTKNIDWRWAGVGDERAGSIRVVLRAPDDNEAGCT